MSRVDAEAALEALARLGLEADDAATVPMAANTPALVPHPASAAEDESMCRLFESPRRPA